MTEVHDAIVVGGGIAGLAAAWRLRHRDVVLLEASERVGGRIRSERRGHYWHNWGAHVFGGEGTATGRLIDETGVQAVPVPGRLTALAMNGVFLRSGRVETYPFRVPMSWADRRAALRAGAKVRAAVVRYGQVAKPRPGEDYRLRQQRMYDFMGERTFADFVGPLPPDADAFFRPTVSRSTGEPEELAAGAGVGYFHLVWNAGAGLSRNIAGGSSTLTEAIASVLGERVRLRSRAVEARQESDGVVVTIESDAGPEQLRARCAVLATPARVAAQVALDLPSETRAALERLVYGPYIVVSFITNEGDRRPWDDCYAIATPKRAFNMVFNMASLRRGAELERASGGSLMAYSAGRLAPPLLAMDDEAVVETYLRDLEHVFPGIGNIVEEAVVQRWPHALPYCFPGRGRLQAALLRPLGRTFLAGDYLGTWYSETAVQSAFAAAQDVLSVVATGAPNHKHSFQGV